MDIERLIGNPIIIFLIIIIVSQFIYLQVITEKDKETKTRKLLKERIDFFRLFWPKFLLYVIATSIILLFTASFILDKNVQLGNMNEWVSLILGMIAMIIGVISLYLSFYNVDQANESLEETRKLLNEINNSISETLKNMEDRLGKKMDEKYKNQSQYGSQEDRQNYGKPIDIKNDKNKG